nr:GAF domain-containing sensor histidine kinase [Candidatus Levybacteria bacterium]
MQPDNPSYKKVFESIWKIEKAVLETVDFEEATKRVVNIILTELGFINTGYEVIVLTMLDLQNKTLKRIAISHTESAEKFLTATPISFNDIIIPLWAEQNLSVRAINEKKMFVSTNVSEVLVPALDREWVDNFQTTLGIKTSIVYPIIAKDRVLGTLIFSLSKTESDIKEEEWSILESFVGAVGIALDNALLFKSLNDATRQLKEANIRLEELDKLKDEFVSLASHELRTPMTIIKSYLWMFLAKKNNLTPKEKTYIERAYESTERLINLVNDMLNVSRIESGRINIEMKDIQIVDVIDKVVSELDFRSQQLGLKLSFTKPSVIIPLVRADSPRIEQVLINLIGNSMKFTSAGGSITVSVILRKKDLLVQIVDTGKGMSSEVLQKLFQKFGTMGDSYLHKQETQGTGLGLYISRALVELQGGKVWAESQGENKGSTFNFTLMYANSKSSQSHEAVEALGGVGAPPVPAGVMPSSAIPAVGDVSFASVDTLR